MGRLTIPISGSHHGIINTIPRIPLQRRLVRKLASYYPNHHREHFPPQNLETTITNIHSISTISYNSEWTNGCLQMFPSCQKLWRYQRKFGSSRTKRITSVYLVLFSTLSTNRTEIGERSSVSKGPCGRFNDRPPNTWDQQNTTTNYHQSKERRSKVDAICSTTIIHQNYHTTDNHPTWQSHPWHFIFNICWRINFSIVSFWRTKLTYCYRRQRHNHAISEHIIISVIVKEEEGITYSSINNPLCATHDNGPAKSGIFSLERG